MAEQGLMLRIGADVAEVTKSLNQVETEIKQLNVEIKKLSGQALVDANKRLDQLSQTANALKNVGRSGFDQFGSAINKIGASAVGAAPALNSLGQVARDLPFGFIAIQNNLPIVVDQFAALTRASGGIGGALKGLGAALIGPAGLAFAFGAITAGVTALIQKYGSLGNAITALTNGNSIYFKQQQELLKIQKEASENAGKEIARLTILQKVSADTTISLKERKEAANELLSVYRTYLPNLQQEALLNDRAAAAINAAKDAILNKALAAAAEEKLAEVGARVLNNRLAQVDALNRLTTAEKELQAQVNKANQQGLQGREGVNTTTVFFNTQLEKAQTNVQKLREEGVGLNKEFENLLNVSVEFAKKTGDAFIDPKKLKDNVTKAAKEIKGVKLDSFVFEFATVEIDKGNTALNDALEKYQKSVILSTNPVEVPVKLTVPQQTFDTLRKIGEDANLKLLEDRTKSITAQFNDFLAPAIDTVFGALANGQDIGKALVQSFRALVVQLTITVVKALALKAILSAIPGFGAVGAAAKGIGGILSGIGGLGAVAAPSFGGVQGGGLQLGGQVVFTQRGTDLVGVLNSANGQIRRVG